MHHSASKIWSSFAGKKVLLLQGPHGPFFKRVAQELTKAGATSVDKVNFNGGDWYFYPKKSTSFLGELKDWPEYLAQLIKLHGFDCVIVFGDCRPVHTLARQVALAQGAEFWAFEEGYIRPNYITLEQHGVNGHSHMPRQREAFDKFTEDALLPEVSLPKSFGAAAMYAMLYFTWATMLWPIFRRYRHHRSLSMLDGLFWIRSYFRKVYYRVAESRILRDIRPLGGHDYFLVVLQVSTDAQVSAHSKYQSITEFIVETVDSFAKHCLDDGFGGVLLIKHHPMDRGYCDYSTLLASLAERHNLVGHVRYIHDQNLPTLLANALGVVTINSTVGLSAIHNSTPVIAMGRAIYDMAGLTCQDDLSQFWKTPEKYKPDLELSKNFSNYLIAHNQINGNFYVALPSTSTITTPKLETKQVGLAAADY
jgi:capsular polysaccharide export protein